MKLVDVFTRLLNAACCEVKIHYFAVPTDRLLQKAALFFHSPSESGPSKMFLEIQIRRRQQNVQFLPFLWDLESRSTAAELRLQPDSREHSRNFFGRRYTSREMGASRNVRK